MKGERSINTDGKEPSIIEHHDRSCRFRYALCVSSSTLAVRTNNSWSVSKGNKIEAKNGERTEHDTSAKPPSVYRFCLFGPF